MWIAIVIFAGICIFFGFLAELCSKHRVNKQLDTYVWNYKQRCVPQEIEEKIEKEVRFATPEHFEELIYEVLDFYNKNYAFCAGICDAVDWSALRYMVLPQKDEYKMKMLVDALIVVRYKSYSYLSARSLVNEYGF